MFTRAGHPTLLCDAVRGGGVREGTMAFALLSAGLQSLPLLSISKLGLSDVDSSGGWVCVHSRTLWVSPMNSLVRLGVSPAAALTPMGVFNQRFEALFPRAGDLGFEVCFAPPQFLLVYLCVNVGPPCGVC